MLKLCCGFCIRTSIRESIKFQEDYSIHRGMHHPPSHPSLFGYAATLGRVLPYLGMVGRFHSDDYHLWDFQSNWVPISCLIMIYMTSFSVKEIGLSLSHLGAEILGPKFGLIFTKMYYLTDLKHFVSIFSLILYQFSPFVSIFSFCINFLLDSLFHWSYIFWPLIFLQNLRSDWV